jgi:hypothetical protein
MIINFGIFSKKKTTVEETVSIEEKLPTPEHLHKHSSMVEPHSRIL